MNGTKGVDPGGDIPPSPITWTHPNKAVSKYNNENVFPLNSALLHPPQHKKGQNGRKLQVILLPPKFST